MENVKVGDTVEVYAEEGHVLFNYKLKVEEIEIGDENEIIAFGIGIDDENEELAEEFTHRIDSSNFVSIVQ